MQRLATAWRLDLGRLLLQNLKRSPLKSQMHTPLRMGITSSIRVVSVLYAEFEATIDLCY